MDPNANNTSTTRGQIPPKPSDSQSGTQGQIPASVAYFPFVIPVYQQRPAPQWEFTPGPYDRQGYYIPPTAGARPDATEGKGNHSTHISGGQPIPSSSTTHPITRDSNVATTHQQSDIRLLKDPKIPYVVLYISLGGPPFTFKSNSFGRHPHQITRAQLSANWLTPSQRAAIWADSKKREQEIISLLAPKEPMTSEQAAKVALNNIRLPVPLGLTQAGFWTAILSLYPSDVPGPYRVLEWAMACPACGQEVVGFAKDALWCMRYLDHRKSLCGKTSIVIH